MLFCNRPIASSRPSIMDIGPTVLDLFGVAVPDYCDGVSLMPAAAPTATPAADPSTVVEPAARGAEAAQ
jgi:arylsulfatase A-like enzyme